jgi:radical SAM protein with 4Fe4S-binding SPASM domain
MTLLNPRRAERCVTSGLDALHFSIDGATPETYERIRVRAHFDRVVRNVELLIETRERLGTGRPRLRMVVVIMRQNLHELPDLIRLCLGWGVEEVFVQHLCHDFGESTLPDQYRPMRDFVEQQTLLGEDPARVEHFFGEARSVAAAGGLDLRLPRVQPIEHPPDTPGRKRCSWPWTGAYVSYQGLAMPCCMVSTPDRINFGNMVERGVPQIWNDEEFQAFRAQLESNDPPDLCRTCAVYKGTF